MQLFFTIVVVLTFLYLFSGVKVVRQGYQYTIEYFGRFTTVANPASIITRPSSIASAAR